MKVGNKVRYTGNGDGMHHHFINRTGKIIDIQNGGKNIYIRVQWDDGNNHEYADLLKNRFARI